MRRRSANFVDDRNCEKDAKHSHHRMETAPAYARALAYGLAHPQQNKRLFGKPYLKYGQCLGLWSYLFEVGGVLGAKHVTNLDAFGTAFLGFTGPPGAMQNYFRDAANKYVQQGRVNTSTTFLEYVQAEFLDRVHYTGDAADFFLEHGTDKLPMDTFSELGWQYADQGAAIGATQPSILRSMFEKTHAAVPGEEWADARAAGLDIPAEQAVTTYPDTEEMMNQAFLAYCQEHKSDLYSVLR